MKLIIDLVEINIQRRFSSNLFIIRQSLLKCLANESQENVYINRDSSNGIRQKVKFKSYFLSISILLMVSV